MKLKDISLCLVVVCISICSCSEYKEKVLNSALKALTHHKSKSTGRGFKFFGFGIDELFGGGNEEKEDCDDDEIIPYVCPDETKCPDDSPYVSCFEEPCNVHTCENHPQATCCNNYCGGCFATFFDVYGHALSPSQCEGGNPGPCENSYCANGGLNIDGICYCVGAWYGEHCESSPCSNCNYECQHGGVCYMTTAGYPACDCPPGFTGEHCEKHPCNNVTCPNGNCCLDFSQGQSTCYCNDGFYGDDCSNSVCDLINCNHGTCVPPGVCECDEGWTGDNCDSENLCNGVTCSGHGTCQVVNDTTVCLCEGDYSGDNCSVSPCTGVTCSGHGSCSVVNSSAECTCDGDYSGVDCSVSPCSGVTCSGHGTCNVVNNSAECTCDGDYSGEDCSVSPCVNETCNEHGTCEVENNVAVCNCFGEYSGDDCSVSPCNGVNCTGHGTCTVVNNEAECTCDGDYSGDNCSVSPCNGVTCSGHGTCTVVNNVANCTCDGEYSGDDCSVSPCDNQDCSGHGTCTVVNNAAQCTCDGEYSGDDCSLSPCSGVNCSGHGTCTVVNNEAECTCDGDYSGDDCSESPCKENTCNGHGTCDVVNNVANCTCHKGWSVEDCSVSVCDDETYCEHSGFCNETFGDCVCTPPWAGANCEDCVPLRLLDIIFVLDETGSIVDSAFEQTLSALKEVVEVLTIGPNDMRVGFATFTYDLNIRFHLDMFSTSQDVMMAIMNIAKNDGSTAIHTALLKTHELMIKGKVRQEARKMVVLIADGRSSIGGHPTTRKLKDIAAANQLKDDDIILICVGISNKVDRVTLTTMATSQELALFTDYAKMGDELRKLINLVVNCHFEE